MNSVKEIIKKLGLEPHPEGGYFKETYRSEEEIEEGGLSTNFIGKRAVSTCIYFLLTSNDFSAFHRIQQDEIWHFYSGSAVRLHTITESGVHSEFIIGNDLSKGEVPQLIVPKRDWFAAEVINENAYTLVGCTVAPGFDFKDFNLPSRKELVSLFPEHKGIITRLTV